MSNKRPIHIKVPGKLMMAGEFAVLEPYHKLVVMAVDRFVYATLENSTENELVLKNFNLQLQWYHSDGNVQIESQDERVNFVESAMNIVFRYLHERSIQTCPFRLSIRSELDDKTGLKYGLGSSAAVVTAVVKTILYNFLPEEPSQELIFKLAAIAHVRTQGNGSGADIAASTFGGVLQYSSFQAEWLIDEYNRSSSITELVAKEWPYLSIKRLKFPKNVLVCIGWTGKPASTSNLVNKILELREMSKHTYEKFLADSRKSVDIFLQGIKEENVPLMLEGFKSNRHCLADIGEKANATIETPLLGKLSDLAEQYGGAGKVSGAGGGDCGVALMPTVDSANQLLSEWEQENIIPLDISIYFAGDKVS